MPAKFKIIIGLLIAVIIGQAIYFNSKLNKEEQKTKAFLQENFSKGPNNNAYIKVEIKEQTPEGEFNDTLYYTLDQWAAKTPDDIKADKQKRVDNWLNMVKNPVPVPYIPPTKEELRAEADTLQQQLDSLNAKINAK